jgi:uncharacterized protein (DUF885 family)
MMPKALAALAVAMALGACSPKPAAPAAGTVDWAAMVNEWIEDDLKANPANAAYQGRHEFDGQLPDLSETGLRTEIARLHMWRTKVEGVDATKLTDDQKFEREYLLARIDGALFWIETADWPHRSPAYYTSYPTGSLDPALYIDREYADAPTRMRAFTLWAKNIPRAMEQIKANLKGPLARPQIDIGVSTFGPLADFVRNNAPQAFASVTDPALKAEFDAAVGPAADALAGMKTYLESLRPTQTEDFALGPQIYAQMLMMNERVDTPIDELERIGRADMVRNQTALADACRVYAPGKTIPQCMAQAESHKPEGGIVAGAQAQLVMLRQFVIDHNVVTVPSEELARVKQSPPYASQNGAYIDIPGPYEQNPVAFYNIAAPDPSWDRQKQLDYIPGRSNLLFTSVHEAWPGHFLQFLHSNRSGSIFGRLYVGYAFAEGWAHYTEEMMWDEGLGNGDPEVHIGQLSNALLRNVRFLSSIGMHTRGMTTEQSKQMFITEGYQDAGTAEQQAARGAYDPGYLNYTMGKLMIRKLRDDWCAPRIVSARPENSPHACWKDFHDAFLKFGGPPIPLVRQAMMREPEAHAVF